MGIAAIRQAFHDNGRDLFNPLFVAGGSAAFAATAFATGLVPPLAGAVFGAPAVGVLIFTLDSILRGSPDDCITAIAKIALAVITAFAASMLVATACGFSITLLEGALLTLATVTAFLTAILLANVIALCLCSDRRWNLCEFFHDNPHLNPLYAIGGSAAFAAAALATGLVPPLAGAAFGAPSIGIFLITSMRYAKLYAQLH